MHQSSSPYRPDLDALRAVAVIAVIGYHLPRADGAPMLPGGLLGVDLFFVLSGWLVTRIVVEEHARRGRFDLLRFWRRRAWRLLPGLGAVIAVSLVAGWAILLPAEQARLGLSALAGLGGLANLFWYAELDAYGAPEAGLQPLLHLWSLALEAQFYLVFPPLLRLLLRRGRRVARIGLMIGFAASALLALWLGWRHPVLAFYAPLARGWEFAAGALLVFAPPPAPHLARGLRLAGLALLALALVSPPLAHPGPGTWPAILAAMALIHAGPWRAGRAGLAGPAWIGRRAYALYLWHVPIFAFGRHLAPDGAGAAELALWLGLSLGLALLSHALIETPLRAGGCWRGLGLGGGVTAGLALALLVGAGHGGGPRAAALARLYGSAEPDNAVLARQSWALLDARAPDERIGPWNARRPSRDARERLWFREAASWKVLIVGDSLSKDLYNALSLNAARFEGVEFARFTLHRRHLDTDLPRLLDAPNFDRADAVLLASRHYSDHRAVLSRKLAALAGRGKRVVVMGQAPGFSTGAALPLFDWHLRRGGAVAALDALAPRFERPARHEAGLRRIAAAHGAAVLPRRALVCAGARCALVTPEGRKTMYDALHWTLAGARLFGARAADLGWFAPGHAAGPPARIATIRAGAPGG